MKKHLFLFGLFLLLLTDANAATTIDGGAFDTVYDAFKAWVGGSLGLTIALLGTIGGLLVLLFGVMLSSWSGSTWITPSGYFWIFGTPLLVGGVIGMVETMAGLGRATFG